MSFRDLKLISLREVFRSRKSKDGVSWPESIDKSRRKRTHMRWVTDSPEKQGKRMWNPNTERAEARWEQRGVYNNILWRAGSSGRWAARRIRDFGFLPVRRSHRPTSPVYDAFARIKSIEPLIRRYMRANDPIDKNCYYFVTDKTVSNCHRS